MEKTNIEEKIKDVMQVIDNDVPMTDLMNDSEIREAIKLLSKSLMLIELSGSLNLPIC